MEIHPSALKHGVPDEDIEHAVRNAIVSDDLDDDLRLYLGPARSAALLEVIVVVREARPPGPGDPRDADAREIPTTPAGRCDLWRAEGLGRTSSGEPVTDELVEKLAAKAEAGFDVDEILRGGWTPAMGRQRRRWSRCGSIRS